ncbi:MAG: D-Ala-D-Ala carboxypeptidase family metallohydrolase [Hyphomonas sp.]|uniref:D-Ala-D-Ala carboxypeptidase family metallohydrolase n=2 Tax=Hyphomonas sp. TaxID=87 RepID=UPI0032986441
MSADPNPTGPEACQPWGMLIRSVSLFDTRGWRWPHFSPRELACKCGGKFCDGAYWHDPDFLDALESLRAAVGRPLIVNSGHRCDRWNAEIGGAEHSMHRQIAVDLALHGHDRFALLAAAEALGFTGLGLGRTFLHLDRRASPARWYYKRSRALWQT